VVSSPGDDLETYRAERSRPVEVGYLGATFYSPHDLSGLPETLPRVPRLRGLTEAERAVALAEVLDGERTNGAGDTTNITVVDAEGNACVLTTSLGLGSGDYLAGTRTCT
jgi:gamma-glutamyltranspeptidase/glutathione hydrolase